MPRIIAAIVDTLANDVVGPIQAFRHPAQAIRFFSDVAGDPQTMINKHVEDYQLIQFATLEDDLTFAVARDVIITGSQWKAAQQKLEEAESLQLMTGK